MPCGQIFTLLAQTEPCQLDFQEASGKIIALNLDGAAAWEVIDSLGTVLYIHLQTLLGGVKIDPTSGITVAALQAAIGNCHAAGGGSAPTPVTVDRAVLDGVDTWVSTLDVLSVSFGVLSSGDPGVTPTINIDGTATPLHVNEQGGWSVIKDSHTVIDTPITITTSVGDVVVVNWSL